MIKDLQHALAVQQRRFDAGKRGTAKAVRRFIKRQAGDDYTGYKIDHFYDIIRNKRKEITQV